MGIPKWLDAGSVCVAGLRGGGGCGEEIDLSRPERPFGYFNLAAAYGQLGRLQEARLALQEGMRLHPDLSTEFIGVLWPYKDAADLDHLVDGLTKAGLPE